MKTINAAVAPGSKIASLELAGRRAYTRMDSAGLKRNERRKQRHALRANLQDDISIGLREGTIHPLATVVEHVTPEMPYNVRHLFAVPAADSFMPGPTREVKVIRKLASVRKPVVETLLLAA